jgi:hypothetical protein
MIKKELGADGRNFYGNIHPDQIGTSDVPNCQFVAKSEGGGSKSAEHDAQSKDGDIIISGIHIKHYELA